MTEEKKEDTILLSVCVDPFFYFDKYGKPLNLTEFCDLMCNPDYRRVALDKIGIYDVSTVWLGFNHSFSLEKTRPIIFETMIFGGKFEDNDYMERYETEKEALEGHKRAIELVEKEG